VARDELPLNDAKEGKKRKKKRLLKGSIRSLAATFFTWGLQIAKNALHSRSIWKRKKDHP
jgi:hypothetical protein